jgi:hypothetical protein
MRNVNELKSGGLPQGMMLAITLASVFSTLLRHKHDLEKQGGFPSSSQLQSFKDSAVSKIDRGRFGNGNILLHILLFPEFCGYEVNRSASVGCLRFCYIWKRNFERGHLCLRAGYRAFSLLTMNYLITSTLAAILKMNGFSAKFFTCSQEALPQPGRMRLIGYRTLYKAWGSSPNLGGTSFCVYSLRASRCGHSFFQTTCAALPLPNSKRALPRLFWVAAHSSATGRGFFLPHPRALHGSQVVILLPSHWRETENQI